MGERVSKKEGAVNCEDQLMATLRVNLLDNSQIDDLKRLI